MEHGVVQNWDDMEAVWRHVFELLNVNPREHPVMLTEPPNNPIGNRIRTAQMFFENFQVPKLFFHPSSVLSLYARGLTTGIVLDVGDGCSHASAIYEGFSIQNATRRIDLGGRDITEHLALLLQRSGYSFRTTAEFQIVRKIKELHCYAEVAAGKARLDYDTSLLAANKLTKKTDDRMGGMGAAGKDDGASQNNANDFVLPDGSKINISNADKSRAPEILFRPSLIGLEYPGIHELVANCIKACDIDLRSGLQSSIVVAGSTTMMKSFCGRLHKSIQNHLPKHNSKVTLMAPANRQHSCWIGGSTIAELKAFDRLWISKRQFENDDARILSLNCM